MLSSLIDMSQDMRTKEKKVEDALGVTWSVYDSYINDIQEIILDSVGMPRDNTVEMTKLHGDPEGYEHEDMFCRDTASEWFYAHGKGELSKEQLIQNVVTWRKFYSKYKEDNERIDGVVEITFLDGSKITIENETVINGYMNDSDVTKGTENEDTEPKIPEKEFYIRQFYSNSIDGSEGKEASLLATSDFKIGIMGFVLSVDCFSIGRDTRNATLYRSSSVRSVDNLEFIF